MMIRHALISVAFGVALFVASCSTRPEDIVGEVRQIAASLCSFEPAITTVVQLFALGIPGLSTASQIAQAICDQVRNQPRALSKDGRLRLSRTPTIHGVRINGEFVR